MTGPLLIVADTHDEACRYAREHGLGRENTGWRYAYAVEHAQGLPPGRYVTMSAGHTTPAGLQTRIELGRHLRAMGWTYGLPAPEEAR